MSRQHPKKAQFFIGITDVTAIGLTALYLIQSQPAREIDIISFFMWLLIVCIMRLGGLFKFSDSISISAGVAIIFEFATFIIFPFYAAAMIIILSCFINMMVIGHDGHKKRSVEPHFHAASVIISACLSAEIYHLLVGILGNTGLIQAVAMFLQAIIFGLIRLGFINTYISLAEKIKWKAAPAIKRDSLILEALLVFSGSIVGIVYMKNPYYLLLFIFLLPIIQTFLYKVNQSKLVYIEEKTGLFNYRYFDKKINETYELCKKNHAPLTLLFADIDFMREINNNYGHAIGDEAIKAVADVFKDFCVNNFIPARFGGEEFVMILPETDSWKGYECAKYIRDKVEEINCLDQHGKKIPLTISIGVASYPKDAGTTQGLIQAADAALYASKRNGRNKVSKFQPNYSKISNKEMGVRGHA